MKKAVVSGFVAALLLAVAGTAPAGEITFTKPPRAVRRGEAVRITFAVSTWTDVEVAVLDAKGKVVRHLAAGMLGKNAPAPLRKTSLSQELIWDGTDDLGRPVPARVRVRVRIGSKPRLERYLGWDGNTIGARIVGLAVGPKGEVFVLDSEGTWGRSTLRVFSRQGRYLRTLIPYSADLPPERTAPFGQLTVEGQRIPIVFNGHGANLLPFTSGMKCQQMAVSPRGYLILAGAVGTIAEHGPPRHLLAVDPMGGAPEGVGFIGPRIQRARGFLGGAGEGYSRFFDHIATSPDGEWIYFVPCKMADRRPRHALFRLKWTDRELGKPFLGTDRVPGNDREHFNDPQGIAVDRTGNIYVCDRGNDRVVVFSPEGKYLGEFAVEKAEQIAVHPRTGILYVLSRGRDERRRDRWERRSTLRKLSPFQPGKTPGELAKLAGINIQLIALDGEAEPPRIWAVVGHGYGRPQTIQPVADLGSTLRLDPPINTSRGLRFPMFIAADPERGRVLLRERFGRTRGLVTLDIKHNTISPLPIKGADIALDSKGNIYTMDGYGTNSLSRYTPEGKPLPFPALGSHTINVRKYRGYGPDIGLRGHCVALNGDVYLIRSNNYQYGGVGENDGTEGRVDVYGPDGALKHDAIVNGLGRGDCGLGVDAAGNIYVGMNVKPADAPLPAYFAGKVPAQGWVWWRRRKRPLPWWYTYYNPYLYHLGAVVKFGPEGGRVYGFGGRPRAGKGEKPPEPSPLISVENAPPGALSLRSGYLRREIRIAGAKWFHLGLGIVPTSDVGWGDPSCVCNTSHLAVDPFGRVFLPNCFRFCVEVLDTSGNLIHRIGRYGNPDDEDGIRFAWPAFISVAGGMVFVSDSLNQRVAVVGFDWTDSAERPVP